MNINADYMNPFDKYLGAEDKIQIAVCEYVKMQYPSCAIHHSPNEGKRSKFEQYKLKKMYTKSGFPDLMLLYKGKMLFIELKASKKVAFTDNQKEWLETFNDNGIEAYACIGFDAAKEIIDIHFAPNRSKINKDFRL
jgi:VRR-NUC domain